ncbi:MAG: group II intron reverse transcriptase/maturase [Tannerellaceae bacterium]|jgi:group II intron reverse transcriptase/maturase|nr:group II intron reverse transcriptase/maturase [Tannerellaceae bacterium]
MIEEVLHPSNLMRAYYQVVRNKGSAGVDGMSVDELYARFSANRKGIEESVREGRYLPQPILGVEIPKSNGRKRLPGVPVVIDRMLQQAVGQVLCNHYDFEFSDYSYGFRPNHSAHQAVMRALEYVNGGSHCIVDMDLKNFFDEVDHCILLQILYRKVKCRQTLRLIRKWLRAPIQIKGKPVKRRKGVPQGSPLSPILSNILLNELDKEMERMGAKYIRFADDFSLYFSDEAQARKTGNWIYLYLRDKLHLGINREKSGIRRPEEFTLLGYGFKAVTSESGAGKYCLVVSEKNVKALKEKLKEITRKTHPYSFDTRVRKLSEAQRGWVQYFGLAKMYWQVDKLDKWVRNRLRYCIRHSWKKPKCRRKCLIRMGVKPVTARQWSHTRMGGWATARSPIMTTTITMARLKRRGYEAMLPLYESITPHRNEPLYTRPVRTVV